MDFIKAIYLFIVFKFAPKTIDSNTAIFWRNSVSLLNEQRKKTGDAFYLWKWRKLFIREPYAYPMASHWTSSNRHPFCWYIGKH